MMTEPAPITSPRRAPILSCETIKDTIPMIAIIAKNMKVTFFNVSLFVTILLFSDCLSS